MAPRRPDRARPVARAACRMLFRLPAASQRHLLLFNHSSFSDGLALLAMLPAPPGYAFAVRQQFRIQGLLCPLLRSPGTVVLAPDSAGSHAGTAQRWPPGFLIARA